MTGNVGVPKPAPFLRWAGGKRKLVPVIESIFPKNWSGETNKFFEPFVGGGSLMIALGNPESKHFTPGRNLIINDVNPDLINTYIAIRDDVETLIRRLNRFDGQVSKATYEKIRAMEPRSQIGIAARFIYLNKTCFNGLWRVNKEGKFNVPWGKIKNPKICDSENLRALSLRLQGSIISQNNFAHAVNEANKNDLIYFDPPYIPISTSSSFSKYAREGFGLVEQFALAGTIEGLTKKGSHVILSNSDTVETREIFGENLYLYQFDVRRSISANSSSRVMVKEILATNFNVPSRLLPGTLKPVN